MTKEETIEILEQYVLGAKPCSPKDMVEACASAYRLLKEQPSLPSTLEEAARIMADECLQGLTISCEVIPSLKDIVKTAVRYGAEWMASQGVTIYRTVDDFGDGASIKPPTEIELYSSGAQLGDKVIVNIRKKDELQEV